MLGRHWTVLKAAWQAEKGSGTIRTGFLTPSPGRETEFLPAVLEVQQAPPSPIGRAILWTILAVFTAGVSWATFGWIDIVATAQGKIIASGYSKTVQPYETGVITAIHVQDGQAVAKGQVLIELDPTQNRADHDRAAYEYQAAKVEAARLRALIAEQATFTPPPGGETGFVRLQQELLREQLAQQQARRRHAFARRDRVLAVGGKPRFRLVLRQPGCRRPERAQQVLCVAAPVGQRGPGVRHRCRSEGFSC